MDKASDFESEDCEFESRRGRCFAEELSRRSDKSSNSEWLLWLVYNEEVWKQLDWGKLLEVERWRITPN